MQIKTILKILGILLTMFSLSMLPPVFVNLIFQDGASMPFLVAFAITLGTGLIAWGTFKDHKHELKTRDGFLIVILFWVVLCAFGAIPLMLAEHPHQSLTDAMFEAVSGLTTTGATVVSDIDLLPHAMRYYRQQMEFLGGMGIVVLAVAILPMLGIGGMQLYRAETPGPIKDSKLTPRITGTAKRLWVLYVGLTIACALSYWLAGMSVFDAIGESFTTVSTGGFSLHETSFAYYNNPIIEMIAVVFMILGATNFALHFLCLQRRSLQFYWRDEEFKTFIYMLLAGIVIVAYVLLRDQIYPDVNITLVKSIFNVVSLATTTGFVSAPFSSWPVFLPIFIMVLASVGGCAASTAGGVKMIRALLLRKQTVREMNRLIHPNAIFPIKFGGQVLPENILQAMWGFIAAYVGLFVIFILLLLFQGFDLISAYGASVSTLANAGASIGQVANGFQDASTPTKWILMFAMLAGRLEIFTLLVLFTPAFWRR